MSVLKFHASCDSIRLLSHGRPPPPADALARANALAYARLGQPPASGQDARGHALRLLRHQSQVDPVDLATRACLSLRQLYQLENGEDSLFYSQSLRNQAARRVTRLLGANWDQLPDQLPDRLPEQQASQLPIPLRDPSANLSARLPDGAVASYSPAS